MKTNSHEMFAESFLIFAKYEEGAFTVIAAHDVIYAAEIPPEKMEESDVSKLNEMGWEFDVDDLERWLKHV